jgi:hypothetical protein
MDPISFISSLVSVIQATNTAINYLKDVKDAPRERLDVLQSLASMNSLLDFLKERVEQSQPDDTWFKSARRLAEPDCALVLLQAALDRLKKQLKPADTAVGRLKQSVKWSFDRTEVSTVLSSMERLKSLVVIALEDDNLCVICVTLRMLLFLLFVRSSLGMEIAKNVGEIKFAIETLDQRVNIVQEGVGNVGIVVEDLKLGIGQMQTGEHGVSQTTLAVTVLRFRNGLLATRVYSTRYTFLPTSSHHLISES